MGSCVLRGEELGVHCEQAMSNLSPAVGKAERFLFRVRLRPQVRLVDPLQMFNGEPGRRHNRALVALAQARSEPQRDLRFLGWDERTESALFWRRRSIIGSVSIKFCEFKGQGLWNRTYRNEVELWKRLGRDDCD